jgi:hypothetical protein
MTQTPTAGTPLTRYGSRVPTTTARTTAPARTAAPTPVTPTATIRTMIVCLPDELPRESLTAHQLDRHFGVTGTLAPRFWATPLRMWQRGQMIGLRKGRPAYCAGGPVRLLDLTAMRQAAAVGAGIRHQVWTAVVHGTRPATPWSTYEARHLADPTRYPYETALADFHRQPRVNAMRMHNAVTHPSGHFSTGELEMLQAGPSAYQHFCAATAVAADALLTADGTQLAPTSDAMSHRVTYLDRAIRYLDTLEDTQRLLAVAL